MNRIEQGDSHLERLGVKIGFVCHVSAFLNINGVKLHGELTVLQMQGIMHDVCTDGRSA